jgi:hypothetical protein
MATEAIQTLLISGDTAEFKIPRKKWLRIRDFASADWI